MSTSAAEAEHPHLTLKAAPSCALANSPSCIGEDCQSVAGLALHPAKCRGVVLACFFIDLFYFHSLAAFLNYKHTGYL